MEHGLARILAAVLGPEVQVLENWRVEVRRVVHVDVVASVVLFDQLLAQLQHLGRVRVSIRQQKHHVHRQITDRPRRVERMLTLLYQLARNNTESGPRIASAAHSYPAHLLIDKVHIFSIFDSHRIVLSWQHHRCVSTGLDAERVRRARGSRTSASDHDVDQELPHRALQLIPSRIEVSAGCTTLRAQRDSVPALLCSYSAQPSLCSSAGFSSDVLQTSSSAPSEPWLLGRAHAGLLSAPPPCFSSVSIFWVCVCGRTHFQG
eukprot:1563977-Rhodomonas_salina.7